MTHNDVREEPLKPGEPAPDFTLPAADREGMIALADYRGRPLLLTLMRGLQCPFCRRNIVRLGAIAPSLRQLGMETLAIVGTAPDRARFYFRHQPVSIRLAADQDLFTHRRYGIACYPVTPKVRAQYRATRVDPFGELREPVPLLGPGGEEIHDVFDRLDAFVPNEIDQRDRTRQFREGLQVCGQYMIDAAGVVRWVHVEGADGGLSRAGIFPSETALLAAARTV